MTYRQLAAQIVELPDDHLDDDVTVYLVQDDEYFGIYSQSLVFSDADDVLDKGHPFLLLNTEAEDEE